MDRVEAPGVETPQETTKAERKKKRGASLVEYVLLISLIAVVSISALRFVGNQAQRTLWNAGRQMGGGYYYY